MPVGLGEAPHVSYILQFALVHPAVIDGIGLTINCGVVGVKTFRW
jgi:hypothetical protein